MPPAACSRLPPPPRLIVAISVDQLSSDLFDEYRPVLNGGFAKLGRGVVFPHAYQGHAATETCPGHSTILTGAYPAHTGIIANTWYDLSQKRADKAVYCAEDERVAGSTSAAYTVSPLHLKVPTLGEYMKRQWPASRTVAVAGKDRAAVMMTGQRPDQRWYWNGKTYATDLSGVATPQSVIVGAVGGRQHWWRSRRRGLSRRRLCSAKGTPVPVGGGGAPVGAGRFARPAGDLGLFRASPEFDGATLALAAGLVREMKLGKGQAPDLIAVGLSATDYVGHRYGTEGQEMCLQMLSLDRDLGDFLAFLDREVGDYAVVLTADHGGKDIPERERAAGVAGAARVDPALVGVERRQGAGGALRASGDPALRRQFRRHVHRPLAGDGQSTEGAGRRAGDLSRASAGRGGVHPRADHEDGDSDHQPRQMEPDRAGAGIVRCPARRAISWSC